MTQRIYIAGPMTGLPDFNYPAFDAAALRLRAAGYWVQNPADNHGRRQDLPRATYLRTAIRQVMRCDSLALLPGWEDSPGARLEVNLAKELGLDIQLLEDYFGEPDNISRPMMPFDLEDNHRTEDEQLHTGLNEDECAVCCAVPVVETACPKSGCTNTDPHLHPRSEIPHVGGQNGKSANIEAINEVDTPSVRAQTLDEAKRLVTGDRNAQYGPPTQDFSRTADLLTALGYAYCPGVAGGPIHAIQPSDIAIIMAQLKVSRLMHSRGKRDSWVDLAGYAACGAECAEEADE